MKLRLAFALLIILAACSTNRTLPDWVSETPANAVYYSAVVRESKSTKNYQEIARDKALRDITMQISTQIESSISVSEHEAWGISGSEYLSTLQATSSASIRDLQLSDSYENAKDYYAFYRLNKAEYHAQRRILCNRAMASAADLLARFDANPNDLAMGIPLLLQALENLVDFLDMELVYGNINIYNEALSRLRALPTYLQLSFTKPRMPATAKLAVTQYAEGRAFFRQQPCPNLPLKFSFEEGEGQITTNAFSDSRGTFELEIKRLNSAATPQRIKLELDKAALTGTLSKAPVIKLWQSIAFAPAYLILDVQRPQIYLDYSFIASYQNGLREVLAKHLANLDLGLTGKLEDAHYLLEVRVFAKPGEYLSNLNYYTSFGDIHLTLKDPHTGATVNYLERLNLKSGGNTREKAERAVEYDAMKAIGDGMLYRLIYDALLK